MPSDPNQLLAQANAASAQADAKADAARKMHAEADLAGQFLESAAAGQSPQMWTGGAARTCHAETDDHRGWLRNVRDHLHNWAHIVEGEAASARAQASTLQQNAAVVQQWQAACAAAAAAVPPQPPPPPPPGI